MWKRLASTRTLTTSAKTCRPGPRYPRARRSGWSGFATGTSIVNRSTATASRCNCRRERSCTCGTHTTTRRRIRATRTARRFVCGQGIAPKTKWPIFGFRYCRCMPIPKLPTRGCCWRKHGCAIACAIRPATASACTTWAPRLRPRADSGMQFKSTSRTFKRIQMIRARSPRWGLH